MIIHVEITEFHEFGIIVKNVRKKLEAEIWEQYRWKDEYADKVNAIFGNMYEKWKEFGSTYFYN